MSISQANPSQLRPSGDDRDGPIIQVGADRLQEAVSRLLATAARGDQEHARQFIEYAQSHKVNLDGLWSRLDDLGRIVLTVLAVPSPGRTAMVFASRAVGPNQVRSLAGLIRHATQHLPSKNVNLAQVLLDPSEELERQVFHEAGFTDLAMLSYLERPVRGGPASRFQLPDWPEGYSIEPYDPSMRSELVTVLSASYEDTLDCPGLRGHRRTEDILEGHLASGIFDARLWTLLRLNGEAVGTLLLNPSADQYSIELVYLGLVKSVRGMSLGRRLLRHGLRLVQHRPEKTINLAVDEANLPAARLYVSEGFRLTLRRRALICAL